MVKYVVTYGNKVSKIYTNRNSAQRFAGSHKNKKVRVDRLTNQNIGLYRIIRRANR